MSGEAPSAARRSTRLRIKTAAVREAELDREMSRGKRQRKAVEKAGTRKRAAKVNPKEMRQPEAVAEAKQVVVVAEAPGVLKVDGAGSAINDDVCAEEPVAEEMDMEEEEEVAAALEAEEENAKGGGEGSAETAGARKRVALPRMERKVDVSEDHFVGEPVPDDETRQRWPERYTRKEPGSLVRRSDGEEDMNARRHYRSACVDDAIFHLDDDVYVKAGPNEENYIGRITEFFEGIDHGSYFTCRWFFRIADTVISPKLLKVRDHKHGHKRVFLSEEKNDNMIESIISKLNIIYVNPKMTPPAKAEVISNCDFYYDMSYSVAYSTFANMPAENDGASGSEATSNISCDDVDSSKGNPVADLAAASDAQTETATLLDLYSGCGAMSTGLCLGAELSDIKLNIRWAVDMNTYACDSLKHNHPCWQVRWKRYDPSFDTWEPIDGLRDSPECIKEFVECGHRENILPLPGSVDVICGGPPCQGISGFNRFRKHDDPLKDEKNKQMVVVMDIVNYLRPKYVLMENVVDILKFADGFLGRYALSRLVAMDYQARLGMMVAGCYGLPQFRMRAFLWGALPSVVIPKFPLPTYDVVNRGVVPNAFSQCLVAYDETQDKQWFALCIVHPHTLVNFVT